MWSFKDLWEPSSRLFSSSVIVPLCDSSPFLHSQHFNCKHSFRFHSFALHNVRLLLPALSTSTFFASLCVIVVCELLLPLKFKANVEIGRQVNSCIAVVLPLSIWRLLWKTAMRLKAAITMPSLCGMFPSTTAARAAAKTTTECSKVSICHCQLASCARFWARVAAARRRCYAAFLVGWNPAAVTSMFLTSHPDPSTTLSPASALDTCLRTRPCSTILLSKRYYVTSANYVGYH